MEPKPLTGLRVIDLSRDRAGAYATLLMAGFGAEVILVEPPGGHPLRHRGPFSGGEADPEKSVPFLWFGQGKRSFAIDIESDTGREDLRKWIAGADMVVESFAPGHLEGLGLGYEALREINPGLVLLSITPFGQTGPYQDFEAEEITIEALSGQMYATGPAALPPLCSGPPIAQMTAGVHAYIAALTALRLRDADGKARHVDVSILEAGVENMELRAFAFWRGGKNPSREDLAVPAIVPWKAYPCQDGWAAILGAPFRRWRYLARLLRGGRLIEFFYARGIRKVEAGSTVDAGSLGGERRNRLKRKFFDHVDERVRQWAAKRTRAEIMEAGRRNRLAFGALRNLTEILDLPQHEARGFFQTVEHPAAGASSYCGAPFPMSRSPWEARPAPRLGEFDGENPWEDVPTPHGEAGGEHRPLPLSGLRIVDLTLVEAAPHATRILADFGAEVIKVEYPARLDVFRGTALGNKAYDRQPFWAQNNRNKRSVTLDLKTEGGREAMRKLVEVSDVVVAGFRGGVLQSLGLDYESIKKWNAAIILVSMSAYGGGGPDSELPSYGGVIEAMTGLQNLTAHPGGKPERIREMDILNGVYGAAAILTALSHRDRNGEGQEVDLSQAEATTHALMGEPLLELAINGEVTPPCGNRAPRVWLQGCYPTRGDDCWLTLCIRDDNEWRAFCDAAGRPEWMEDARFASPASRRENHDALDEAISDWTRGQDAREAMTTLQKAGVAAGAVADLDDVVADPHLRSRNWFVGDRRTPGSFFMGFPFRISGVDPPPPKPGPALGEGNAEILGELLGIPAERRPDPEPGEIRSAFHLEDYSPASKA